MTSERKKVKNIQKGRNNKRFFMRNIILGQGFDKLLFGSSREEVKKYLGEPDTIERYPFNLEEQKDFTEEWSYKKIGLSASFAEVDNYRLNTLEINSNHFLLEGKSLIGLTKKEVIEFILTLDYGPLESEDMSSQERPDYELISFDKVSLNLWFEKEVLTEIQWSPFWLDDEHPMWPE